jgi:Ras family protein T1
MTQTVRICVVGDDATGKSSLITSLVKDVFVTSKIQPVLPQITLPPTLGTPDNVTTVIVDTSAQPSQREALRIEIKKCNVVLLVYSDHYSYERVALFWLPYFRSLGVNVPVVLCANKSDLPDESSTAQVVEEQMLPVMAEFKEIDSCIRTSAREHHNINEVFYLCQKVRLSAVGVVICLAIPMLTVTSGCDTSDRATLRLQGICTKAWRNRSITANLLSM